VKAPFKPTSLTFVFEIERYLKDNPKAVVSLPKKPSRQRPAPSLAKTLPKPLKTPFADRNFDQQRAVFAALVGDGQALQLDSMPS